MEKMDALNDSLTSGGLIDWEKVADIFAPLDLISTRRPMTEPGNGLTSY